MNMISTGAFLEEADASSKKEMLLSKLVSAWEKKNAKVARLGGVSLMALSLAACGSSSDDTSSSSDSSASADDTSTITPTVPTVDAAVVKALQISSTTGLYDDVAGGSGADTFIAGAGALETGDAVNGGGGSDVLSATYTASVTAIPVVTGVETINIRSYGNNVDVVFDMDTVSGATHVYVDRMDNVTAATSASVTFNNLDLGTVVGINKGAAAATSAGDAIFTFLATTGAADSVSLDLKDAMVNDVTIAGIETINITTSVDASTLNSLVVANASTINISGNKALTITTAVDMADTTATAASAIDGTIDASAMTGNLSIGVDNGDNAKITGGSGADTFAMTDGLDKNDVLDGGTGADTVSVTAVADDASLDLSTYQLTSIESFAVTGAAGAAEDPVDITIAADAAGVSTLVLTESQAHTDGDDGTDEGTFTVTGLSSGDTVRLVSDKVDATGTDVSQIGAVTLSMLDGSATTDSLTVELAGTTAQTAVENTVDDLVVTQVETLNIVSAHTGVLASSVLTATDDNTLGDISADAKLTTLNISGSDQASITVGSEATKLATINTAGMSDDLALTLAATATNSVTGGAAKETINFAATLNNSDTVDLAAGVDTLTATVTNLTATTGALNVSNVETLNLTNAGTAVIDATKITGATEIAVLNNATKTTITGLAAGTKVGLGFNNTDGDVDGILDVALADATGTADTLTINFNDTAAANNSTVDLRTTGVETLVLDWTDATDTGVADATLDVDAINAATVTITGADVDVGHALSLQTLDTDTTTVDATGYFGILTAASGTAIATSFTARGDRAHSLTGSSKNDTFTISTATTNQDMTIDGNGGTDTLSMILGTGRMALNSITDVDTINFSSTGTVAITSNGATTDLDGINEATKVTFSGGNSISTITLGGATDVLTATNTAVLDFSNFAGSIADATFGAELLDNGEAGITVQVIGTANKDTVSGSFTGSTDATVSINTQGVETLDIALANSATAVTADMALVTGLTRINVTDHSSETVTFNNLITGVTIDALSTNGTATSVTAGLADATGSTDTQTFIVGAVSADDNVALTMADVETINISSDTTDQVDLSLAGISMTAASATNTVNFTGTNDIELMATGTDVTTINASGMGTGGAIVQTGRTSANASTYTGSSGNDTFIMMSSSDVLDGGAGTGDTLDINMTQAVGTAIIDLTAADQIASFNGGANTVVQTGFENVDLAGLLTNGAVVTGTAAANTLTGSGLVDQIDGGAGADTITGGTGNDVLTGGAASDTFVFNAVATNGSDTIVDFVIGATADVLEISAVDSDLNATLKVATLSANGSTLTDLAGGGTAAAADVDVIIHLDTTNLNAIAAAKTETNAQGATITDNDGAVHVFFNTTTTNIEVYHNTDESGASGTFTLLASLDGTVAGDIASIVTADFS
jgi:hypothetical protein